MKFIKSFILLAIVGSTINVNLNRKKTNAGGLGDLLTTAGGVANNQGFNNAGRNKRKSNCFPFKDFNSTKKVLSPMVCSARPQPVIEYNIMNSEW